MSVIALEWNRPQGVFIRATQRYVDLEGAVRSGKTTALVWKVIFYGLQHPGIHCMLSRWTDDALKAQLKPRFYELCPKEFLGPGPNPERGTGENGWNADAQYQEFKNGSRVYLRGLKSSDEGMRYGKFAGLTLAVIGVDQPEEVPKDVYAALLARLSQRGFPQQMLLTPNPPGHDHWLADPESPFSFPEGNTKPDHLYLTTEVYDNEKWLGKEYIKSLELIYPPGTVLHRRFILGKRGLSTEGEPVYGQVFKRRIHVVEALELIPHVALFESWDFGHKHPAVLWSQLDPHAGTWNVLGEYMGTDEFIEDFAPRVISRRASWFPAAEEVWACCDPAGADNNSQGTRNNAISVLGDLGIYPRFVKGSNSYAKRDYAIQQIARYMLRMTKHGPALQIDGRRAPVLVDGFEAGYVYDDGKHHLQALPNVRRPKKDGYYDHLQNTAEYTMLNFLSGLQVGVGSAADLRRVRSVVGGADRELRAAQRDRDEFDRYRRPAVAAGRAGY